MIAFLKNLFQKPISVSSDSVPATNLGPDIDYDKLRGDLIRECFRTGKPIQAVVNDDSSVTIIRDE